MPRRESFRLKNAAAIVQSILLGIHLAINSAAAGSTTAAQQLADSFSIPEAVTIVGYDGHAMEPFLTRDGKFMFFNTRNMPSDQTDLHVARLENATTFKYIGPVAGANSSLLDGVASLDRSGRFYFISNRDYDDTGNTLWSGHWIESRISNAGPVATNFTPKRLLRLNIDMEISADGEMLYVAENRWDFFRGIPATSDLTMARLKNGNFERLPNSDTLMRNINSKFLEFAPATTADQRTLYFTRLDMKAFRKGNPDAFAIMVSTRRSAGEAWSEPTTINAIQGHAEGPTVTPDNCAIYFHKLIEEKFQLFRSARKNCPRN